MLITPKTRRGSFVAPALGLGLALAGCGDAGPGGEGEPVSQVQSPLFANDVTACNYFVGKGLTTFQAAGIVGNLDQESGVDPTAVQYGGGPGRGIAQWSVGGRWDTSANDNATWYASKTGEGLLTLQLQLDFIWYELTNIGYGYSALVATTNVTDATTVFQDDFEICGTCDASTRIAYAQAVLPNCQAPSYPYAASFVSQSFPLASTTLTMVEGQVISSYIELKNTGTKTWDSNTRIGTTQPRDRVSVFADSTWVSNNRPAAVKGTVAPGGTYKFTFDLAAPSTPGNYLEYFGVVEDGVAWFSDPGQGGPPDDDLEANITVVAPEYRGTFKDQSFPLAPTTLTVHVGDVATGYIELTNSGTQTWKSGTTKLAPIPRDTASPFADKSWLSPTRISTVAADVAPGDVGRFEVALDANAVGDTEIEFGLVEESVTWFAVPTLGGGPADGFLKVHLVVVPEDAALDAGADEGDAGRVGSSSGGSGSGSGGAVLPGDGTESDAGWENGATGGKAGGCSVAVAPGDAPPWTGGFGVMLVAGAVVRAARRRRDAATPE
jgi:MYXO-CTERM domain-containing protein